MHFSDVECTLQASLLVHILEIASQVVGPLHKLCFFFFVFVFLFLFPLSLVLVYRGL